RRDTGAAAGLGWRHSVRELSGDPRGERAVIMMRSQFPELLICPQPINYQAVYVGFFKGEHFEVEFTEDRPKRRLTLDNPPRRPATPKGIADHSGNRNGRMTALYWVAPTKNKKPERVSSWWCVKCDCGR